MGGKFVRTNLPLSDAIDVEQNGYVRISPATDASPYTPSIDRVMRAVAVRYGINRFKDFGGNRGDSTPIELFVEGVSVWEPGIRRLLSEKAVSHQ